MKSNWLAASIFCLSGWMLYITPALVRGQLYAASITRPSWSYPDDLIESMVPAYLQSLSAIPFLLAAGLVLIPYIRPFLVKLFTESP